MSLFHRKKSSLKDKHLIQLPKVLPKLETNEVKKVKKEVKKVDSIKRTKK